MKNNKVQLNTGFTQQASKSQQGLCYTGQWPTAMLVNESNIFDSHGKYGKKIETSSNGNLVALFNELVTGNKYKIKLKFKCQEQIQTQISNSTSGLTPLRLREEECSRIKIMCQTQTCSGAQAFYTLATGICTFAIIYDISNMGTD